MAVTIETTLTPLTAMAFPAIDVADETAAALGAEQTLLARVRKGDPSAFDEMVVLHHPRVSRLAYRLLGWSRDAEDVVQDVFLAAFETVRRFEGRSTIATWLTSITLNKCRTQRRRRLLRMKVILQWWQRRGVVDAESADSLPERDETCERVREAVQALPPRDREVVVLHYLEQIGVEEMASLLGLSRNAVEVRLHRARARLKVRLVGLIDDV